MQFSVYDFDRFSRHDLIGQVVLKGLLDCTDLEQEIEYTMDILCALQVPYFMYDGRLIILEQLLNATLTDFILLHLKEKIDLGELMLSLCYLPTAGRLTLTVVKARNLKAMDITGKSGKCKAIYFIIILINIYDIWRGDIFDTWTKITSSCD